MWRIGGLRLYCGTVSSNSTASAVGAKVGATDGNDGTHTTGCIDYDRRNLIRLALQSGPDIVIIIKRRFNMRYWLTSGDGKTYGPYEVSELHKFATEGRTSAASQLCAEGSTSWVPFSNVIQQTRTAAPAPAPAPAPQPFPFQQQQNVQQFTPVNIVFPILVTLCCCLPCGIVSIVYASQANSMGAAGNIAGAMGAASNSKTWGIIGAVGGVVIGGIYLVLALAAASER